MAARISNAAPGGSNTGVKPMQLNGGQKQLLVKFENDDDDDDDDDNLKQMFPVSIYTTNYMHELTKLRPKLRWAH